MKNLEIRTQHAENNTIMYKNHLKNVIVFLRHDEDKIIVRSGELVEVEIYDNGKLIFSGDKIEFYNKLKSIL